MNTKENIVRRTAHVGGQWQRPAPDAGDVLTPARTGWRRTKASSATRCRSEASVGQASNSLNYDLQLDSLYRANSGLSAFPYLYPDAVQADYIPQFEFRGGPHGQRGSVQYQQRPVHEREQDDRHHRERDQGVGPPYGQGWCLLPAQPEAAEAFFFPVQRDGELAPTTPATRSTRATRTRTRPPGCTTPTRSQPLRGAQLGVRQLRGVSCRTTGSSVA